MKKILALVLAMIMVLSLTAAFADEFHFEIVSKGFQSTYWQAVLKGAQEEVDKINGEGADTITMNFVGPDSESDVDKQVQQFTSALNANPAAIGFAAVDQNAFNDLLAEAIEKKIPIIGFDSGVPGAPEGAVYANASTNNYVAGTVAAEGMWEKIVARIEAAEGTVRIGEVNQDATGESVTQRGLGFIDKIIELPRGKLLADICPTKKDVLAGVFFLCLDRASLLQ
ncbi:MAG: substrate-binding domain-containing protein, partial [Clostridia bacterium]|nr:substrate-binding domain-containing protein [Clostridia bacterium]